MTCGGRSKVVEHLCPGLLERSADQSVTGAEMVHQHPRTLTQPVGEGHEGDLRGPHLKQESARAVTQVSAALLVARSTPLCNVVTRTGRQ